MKIDQVSVAGCLGFFERGFIDRWNLRKYYNQYLPCFFFGAEQIDVINNHKGVKIIYLSSRYDTSFLRQIIPGNNIVLHKCPFLSDYPNFKVKDVEIELKDYSMFKPNVLGNKIYSYIGYESRASEFGLNTMKEIQKCINHEIVFMIKNSLYEYISIEQLKKEYYDNCFLNLNLSEGSAMTTVREFGLMGRKTIMNSPYNFPSLINYVDIPNIVDIINSEAKKIGTIQPSIDCHTVKDEWLDVDFWFN